MQNSMIYYQAEVAYRRELARAERRGGWLGRTRNQVRDDRSDAAA
jgi:hypothetical protein